MEFTKDGRPKPQAAQPIRKMADIRRIKDYLVATNRFRDLALFTLGINTGYRAGDILTIRISQVEGKGELRIIEEKTGKPRTAKINQSAREAIDLYLQHRGDYTPDDWLFPSQKFKDRPLTVRALQKIIKTLMRNLGIPGSYSSHTLRKTMAYQAYQAGMKKGNPGILHTLQKMMNHSSEAITLRYIGIEQDTIDEAYIDLNL